MIRSSDNRHSGFTLLETLLAAAILLVLLSLSMVGVARWRDPLKITELDNAARAIYMAAENRAVLLQNSGAAAARLSLDVPSGGGSPLSDATATLDDGTAVSLRVLSDATAPGILDDLLPTGVVDPRLRDGHFYILYDQSTCHVFEVFYAEKPFDAAALSDLRDKSRSERIQYCRDGNVECLVGHYGDGLAGKFNAPLPTPGVDVLIENGEELTLSVKYTLPSTLPKNPDGTAIAVTRTPRVTLDYDGSPVTLLDGTSSPYASRLKSGGVWNEASGTAEYVWVLDSLEQDAAGQFIKQFKGLVSGVLGGDFMVTASLTLSAEGYLESSYFATGRDNSLFDASTHNGDTAYISNLRHLQNLDTESSGVEGKKAAVQLRDIDAGSVKDNEGTVVLPDYKFLPIVNWDLYRYSATASGGAATYSISNLSVTADSAKGKYSAGLFGIAQQNFLFQDVRIVESEVASGTQHAGALMGYSWNSAKFENCQVIDSKVTGGPSAGGIVGAEANSTSFTGCTLENVSVTAGSGHSGGLAGQLSGDGSPSFTFRNCQAANISVIGSGVAGGMAGYSWVGTIHFENCAAEGLTVSSQGSYAGGMMGSEGSAGRITFLNCTVGQDEASAISVAGTQAGGLIGNADGETTITKCVVGKPGGAPAGSKITVTGTYYAGGLVGNSAHEKNMFTECRAFSAEVTATGGGGVAGGLIGGAKESFLEDCNTGNLTVRAGRSAGGLIGEATDVGLNSCGASGIFAKASYAGGLAGNSVGGTFDACKAVDARADAGSEAGGLAGRTTGTNLRECLVYWSDLSGLKNVDGTLQYSVTAETAGGLVGAIRNGGRIVSSFAATLVRGTVYAGGLAGNLAAPDPEIASVSPDVQIVKSYADCYLYAGKDGVYPFAGGLIGMKAEEIPLTLENVYAAGFIEMAGGQDPMAAGLCSGWAGKITAVNAYAAMHYDGAVTVYPLAAGLAWGQGTNCYWLDYSDPIMINNVPYEAKAYADMSDPGFIAALGGAFGKPAEMHPYNLDGNTRGAYPFPGLNGLPHYGDWLTKP